LPLDPPPRDEWGETLPHDHVGIQSGDGVIRRISPHQLVYDEKIRGKRISSKAYSPSSEKNGRMSVDLQRVIEEAGINAKAFVSSPPWIGAVSFTAGSLRSENLLVGYDPTENNPYHGQVWGRFSKQIRRKLAELATPFVAIKDS